MGSTPQVAGLPREIPTPTQELKPAKFEFDLEGEAIELLRFLYEVPLLPLSQHDSRVSGCEVRVYYIGFVLSAPTASLAYTEGG